MPVAGVHVPFVAVRIWPTRYWPVRVGTPVWLGTAACATPGRASASSTPRASSNEGTDQRDIARFIGRERQNLRPRVRPRGPPVQVPRTCVERTSTPVKDFREHPMTRPYRHDNAHPCHHRPA